VLVVRQLTVDNAWTEGDPTVFAGIQRHPPPCQGVALPGWLTLLRATAFALTHDHHFREAKK
jgi:hypothetical protein